MKTDRVCGAKVGGKDIRGAAYNVILHEVHKQIAKQTGFNNQRI